MLFNAADAIRLSVYALVAGFVIYAVSSVFSDASRVSQNLQNQTVQLQQQAQQIARG